MQVTRKLTLARLGRRNLPERVRIDDRVAQPVLVLPAGNVGEHDALPRQVDHHTQVARVREMAILVARSAAKDASLGAIGELHRRPELVVLKVDLRLWEEKKEGAVRNFDFVKMLRVPFASRIHSFCTAT